MKMLYHFYFVVFFLLFYVCSMGSENYSGDYALFERISAYGSEKIESYLMIPEREDSLVAADGIEDATNVLKVTPERWGYFVSIVNAVWPLRFGSNEVEPSDTVKLCISIGGEVRIFSFGPRTDLKEEYQHLEFAYKVLVFFLAENGGSEGRMMSRVMLELLIMDGGEARILELYRDSNRDLKLFVDKLNSVINRDHHSAETSPFEGI